MNTYLDCVPCFLRQSLEAARMFTEDTRVHERIVRDVLRLAAELDLDRPPPFVGQVIHRRLRALTGVRDPYLSAKRSFNRLAMEALPDLIDVIEKAPDPLLAAAKCAVAANAIDMGGVASVTEDVVREALRGAPREPLCGHGGTFRETAGDAADILYLADNAGELAVDRLLIEQLGPDRVTVAVRGAPVLNDATLADADETGLTDLVDVIDNGSDAPGTILADCSESFLKRFESADLVIAKGQGNFETLSGLDKQIVFLFKVKCPVVCREVGLPVGTHVLWDSRGHRPPLDGGSHGHRT
jgi:uncharacterized protein with ATP-grasp and redox domains